MGTVTLKMSDVVTFVNDEITLRKVNDHKVAEYAERMAAGVKFPAIVIGHWPKSEKYGEAGIVETDDGKFPGFG